MSTPRLTVIQSDKTTVTSSPRVLRNSDDDIWKRLEEAGFDEDSIKRRDKASLIAYITKLESEIYDHQYQMGLLIMERKEWVSKFEQTEAALNSAELMRKHDKASHVAALAEAKKREDNLKKAIEIERECLANIEKTLHELRAEYAETKVSADSKLAEARSMMEDALKKLSEADAKMLAAESLEAEAGRFHRAAERKLHEVEAREDDLRRRAASFKTECDTKDEEFLHERQSLCERQKSLQQSQQRLVDGQELLNKRESHIFDRTQELNRKEKELEASKLKLGEELQVLAEEQANLKIKASSLSLREEVVTKRECEVKKREEGVLVLQDKLEKKESERIQQLLANYEASLSNKKSDFEAELEMRRKLVHDDIENKRRDWELREVDLHHREELISEKEHELDMQSRAVVDKESYLTERFSLLVEKENSLDAMKKEIQSKESLLQKEKEEINSSKLDLQKSLDALKNEKQQIHHAEEKMKAMKSETDELFVLESKLKEEIETIRAQKQELEVEADEMKELKLKFEVEWQSIDEKRKELQKEAECINGEREALYRTLKDERNSLKLEKDAIWDEYTRNNESLSRDREEFLSKMEHERSELFSNIQKERSDFSLAFEVQTKDLEDRLAKRREEIESNLAERERAFEEEKRKELMRIDSLRETLARETEQVNLELNRLDTERREINLDREKRDREWAELNSSIEELKAQRQKLEKQRELMRADKEDILVQIEHLKQLEDRKVVPDRLALTDIQQSDVQPSKRVSARRFLKQQSGIDSGCRSENNGNTSPGKSSVIISPPVSTPFSWLKRCASSLLEQKASNKKMRHSEEIVNPSTISARLDAPEDEHAVKSVNQAPVHAKETTVYIDKIITIREVTSFNDGRVNGNSQDPEKGLSLSADEKLEGNDDIKSVKPNKNGEVKQKMMQASLTEK
ncbi:uncharacterized protein LOC141723420 isoform X2 [Apium graveolens]|uniref:Nuclear matrix constituent protein 2 n=1 Tax=Apium graveolens TaxID=4045 RepID=D2YZU6_APIGR|nr:nuclear matrix constituent protein 2 [Apium graveolens]